MEPTKGEREQSPLSQSSKEELYLVIGSTREAEKLSNYWQKIIGQGKDFTHKNTYGGKAITLNLFPSKIKKLPHIRADATTYNPGPKAFIKAAFFELFPSIKTRGMSCDRRRLDTEAQHDRFIEEIHLMPHAIDNIAKYMPQGAQLDIEHIPHLVTLPLTLNSVIPMLRTINPFSWYLSPLHMEALESLKYQEERKQDIYWKMIKTLKMKDEG